MRYVVNPKINDVIMTRTNSDMKIIHECLKSLVYTGVTTTLIQ